MTDLYEGFRAWMGDEEKRKRDAALDLLERTRASLIAKAKVIAERLCERNGSVTSVEVLAVMREDEGTATEMAGTDTRWAGAIFRKGWERVGWEPSGSHGRPVARWRRGV